MREIARTWRLSRYAVKKLLTEHNTSLLTNDEALVFANRKHARERFNGTDAERAYLYGFVVGDVAVFKKSKFTLRAITHTTRKSFVALFTRLFSKYGHINCKMTKQSDVRLFVDLDYESFAFLESRLDERMPVWLAPDVFYHFFAGLIDSDGTIMLRQTGEYFQQIIRVFGENKAFLLQLKEVLEKDGFQLSFYRNAIAGETRTWKGRTLVYNKDYYVLEMCRKEDAARLLSLLPVQHEEKVARKQLALSVYARGVCKWAEIKEEVLRLRQQQEQATV